ncbi:lytic exoenzyme target recognition domain-containing protein [Enterococcus quebecensis]|uniref:Lytic exoenzyme target recognition domain-containing protein n=1 Tax=Enterococcus quebecensis TaxID=903983 RepID=A0A1E5GUB7_9ENTE|nr:lytic exoenzyme target recognition domain-containing protein [Enterococcus quebecensis]OEG16271.1 hypothetical protein BCR23_05120 [Enterococcus quebecensis]OJG74456.1 hypothetical protein RV12_GL002513 [Enterococcus quebecensis]
MLKRKLLVATVGLGLLFFGNNLQASADVKVNPDDLKINAKANEEAIKFVEEHGGLENSPVPPENLTTEQPSSLTKSSLYNNLRAIPRVYAYDALSSFRQEIRCNYLAPAGFTWADNGIPFSAVNFQGGRLFTFNRSNVKDERKAGLGTGGWYWRFFSSEVPGKGRVYYWLSASDLNHLIYG